MFISVCLFSLEIIFSWRAEESVQGPALLSVVHSFSILLSHRVQSWRTVKGKFIKESMQHKKLFDIPHIVGAC